MKELLRNFFKKKAVKITAIVLASVLLVLLILELGSIIMATLAHPWSPNYEREDISKLLDGELDDADYDTLYRQTGLTRIGIDDLLAAGRRTKILKIQDSFFAKDDYESELFGAFVCAYDRKGGVPYEYPILRDGDVICCFSTYLSFIEIGHCGIVIDGERGIIAESAGYSTELKLVSAEGFFTCTSFIVLRPDCDEEIRSAAVEYVKENMLGAKYDILAGIFEKKDREPLRATHCSHAVWYAYNKVGVEIDSNGGKIVTPKDISLSENLKIVAVRGVDIFDVYR